MSELIIRKEAQRRHQMTSLKQRLSADPDFSFLKGEAIIQMEPKQLMGNLRTGKLKAVDVLKAFQWKALNVTETTNCITEFILGAEVWAAKCDKTPAGERGILHGIPVSIKENIDVTGMDSTHGVSKYLNKPASSDSILVQVLLENGAVPFCKTNMSQSVIGGGCSNPIYGTSLNPFDPSRSPAGGEAALIASGGAILGIGTDVGGNARMPANYCGCVGLKPTANRLTSGGSRKIKKLIVGVCRCPGIMGKNVEVVERCMQALIKDHRLSSLDPNVIPIPWNGAIINSNKKLTFGYFESFDLVSSTPGVTRAVREAKMALEKAGHKVIPFKLPGDEREICEELFSLIGADDGRSFLEEFENELVDPSLQKMHKILQSTPEVKAKIKHDLEAASDINALMFNDKYKTSFELWKGLLKRDDYVMEITKMIRECNIDLLLSPVLPFPAPLNQGSANVNSGMYYCVIFNYLDFPSGCVPVTTEMEEDQWLLMNRYPVAPLHHRAIKQSTKGATGLPIGVQITGLRWQDELVCRGMAELEKSLSQKHKWKYP